jgi:hypothetical protein
MNNQITFQNQQFLLDGGSGESTPPLPFFLGTLVQVDTVEVSMPVLKAPLVSAISA